jgi:hypothetical protein
MLINRSTVEGSGHVAIGGTAREVATSRLTTLQPERDSNSVPAK